MAIDLPFHRSWIEDDEIQEVLDTLKSSWLTTGPKTQQFENDFKAYIGCKYAIGLSSCTAGLHISLALLELERGMEVITTPMTFPATTNVILHQGLNRDAWKRYGKSGFSHWELHYPGYKYNLTDIHAAMGIHQLKRVERFLQIRQDYATVYDGAFKGVEELQVLQVKDYAMSARHIYVIALNLNRLSLSGRVSKRNAGTGNWRGCALHPSTSATLFC
jgi:dTDP-4-amino-4,6-dideoxygalactose transaminase